MALLTKMHSLRYPVKYLDISWDHNISLEWIYLWIFQRIMELVSFLENTARTLKIIFVKQFQFPLPNQL